MNETQNNTSVKANEKEQYFTLKLLIIILLSFAAALVFRPSAGILAMTPVALIIVFFASFVKLGLGYKVFCFGVTVFALNSTQHGDVALAGVFAGLCVLACLVFHISVTVFAKKRNLGYLSFGIGAAACTVLCFLLVGNPFSALEAKDMLNSYTETYYPEELDGAPTQYQVSPIRYDALGGFYYQEINSKLYPTDTSTLTVCGSYLCDNFAGIMEYNMMEPARKELTALLREAFPDASFEVTQKKIAGFPKNCAVGGDTHGPGSRMHFEIRLGGVQLTSEFEEKAKSFLNVIDKSGFEYSRITFIAGSSYWYKLACDVDSSHFSQRADVTPALRFSGSHDGMLRYPDVVVSSVE